MKHITVLSTLAAMALPMAAQNQDSQPMDINQLLQELKKLRETNAASIKSRRMNAFNKVRDAASSGEKAVAFWKEAVKITQFEGAKREGAQISAWRDGDGDALNDKHCMNAVRLHLQWLALSLEHAAGAEMKALLPHVIEHTRAIQADTVASENLAEQLEKDRNSKNAANKKDLREDSAVKRVHDTIIHMPVTESPVARWLQLRDILDEIVQKKPKNAADGAATPGPGWEHSPGSWDGIYSSIILPEFRFKQDPRLLEYWDFVIKREADRVAARQLDIEKRDWTNVKHPRMLWSRAQDVLILGQKNRALTEMFNLIKQFPTHPEADSWIEVLEGMIAAPLAPASPTAAVPANGAVPAPVAVPAPTGPIPVGTIIPSGPTPTSRPPAR